MLEKLSKHTLEMCDLNDLEKSDNILCKNTGYLSYQHIKENDTLFRQQMQNTVPRCLRDVGNESKMFLNMSSKVAICSQLINNRGKSCPEPSKTCPSLYSAYTLNDFLLVPCPKNTYKNYLVFDDKKTCSKSHQILNNWTRRKDISTPQT
jgi:hypothetical protein